MAGGFKNFGPTYNSTGHVRLGYEGLLNGAHEISSDLITAHQANGNNVELAGKFAAITAKGVELSTGENAVGLFREDLNDMVNASEKATFYFRGGEYYVNAARTNHAALAFVEGDKVFVDSNGKMTKTGATGAGVGTVGTQAVGVVTHVGEYRAGNMYDNANKGVTDADTFIGFIMFV